MNARNSIVIVHWQALKGRHKFTSNLGDRSIISFINIRKILVIKNLPASHIQPFGD